MHLGYIERITKLYVMITIQIILYDYKELNKC